MGAKRYEVRKRLTAYTWVAVPDEDLEGLDECEKEDLILELADEYGRWEEDVDVYDMEAVD